MRFVFAEFELDTRRGDLRQGGQELSLEPRAYALLCLLVENHDRLVTRDEIVEKVWDGRVISDSAVSTGIKFVRKVLGDSGTAQKFVKTIHGRGFRFVSPVRIGSTAEANITSDEPLISDPPERPAVADDKKPSVAILPFGIVGFTETYSAIGDAIPTELISSLSRLRWLRVIARGSTFRFRSKDVDLDVVRTALGAAYCLTGIVEIFGKNLAVVVELIDSGTHDVVWSDRFPTSIDDIHEVRSRIVTEVIAALELHIPLNEANKARLTSPESLDAWSEFHIGLQHMYRFNRTDNEVAAMHFERATTVDPRFARAFAARSFTSFQRAFMKYSADIEQEKLNARRFAEKSLEIDPYDPFGNFNLARTHWLEGNPENGVSSLERALQINPNFAQGHYALGWTDVMAGRGEKARACVDAGILLSPLDPLMYAMQAARGFSLIIDGDYQAAAEWAERAARAPGAHFLIGAIAVAAHQLNGDLTRSAYWLENVRTRRSDASIEHFFTAFPFSDEHSRESIARALADAGM
jgi:DNA-binding winged helix-turn-helix (wHTH) protein/tetratricopeptide (TPR) repeat protein